jgi:hypothetical protein
MRLVLQLAKKSTEIPCTVLTYASEGKHSLPRRTRAILNFLRELLARVLVLSLDLMEFWSVEVTGVNRFQFMPA